ncbi:MAG TPA: hypothetical protein ENN75_01455 [candidate division Zixibacteria bacterium]|nr:hypothetical protein [candidate division Zixibacteria bacterium]
MMPIFMQCDFSETMGGIAGAGCCGVIGLAYFLVWASAIAFSIFMLVFKVMMIIDVARKRFAPGGSEQVVWILVILLVPIGSIIYYFAVKHNDPSSPGIKPRPAV